MTDSEIALGSCVKIKREEAVTPKNLYTFAYFGKMRAYAERYHDENRDAAEEIVRWIN